MQPRGLWLILYAMLDLTRADHTHRHLRAHMADRTLSVLIGDAQPRVRFGLHVLLEEQPGWRVAGEAVDARALLDQIRGGCPEPGPAGLGAAGYACRGAAGDDPPGLS